MMIHTLITFGFQTFVRSIALQFLQMHHLNHFKSFEILLITSWGKPRTFPTSHRFNCVWWRRCGRWGRIGKHHFYEGNLGRTQRVASWWSRSHLCWFTSLGALDDLSFLTPQGWWKLYRRSDFVWELCKLVDFALICLLPPRWWMKETPLLLPVSLWLRRGGWDLAFFRSNVWSSRGSESWTSNSLFLQRVSGCPWLACQKSLGWTAYFPISPSSLRYWFLFQKSKDMPKTSALLFEGSWRIHVMIDTQLDGENLWKKTELGCAWDGRVSPGGSCFSFLS